MDDADERATCQSKRTKLREVKGADQRFLDVDGQASEGVVARFAGIRRSVWHVRDDSVRVDQRAMTSGRAEQLARFDLFRSASASALR